MLFVSPGITGFSLSPGWSRLPVSVKTHSSLLAWRKEPDRLQSMGLQRVEPDWVTSIHTAAAKSLQSCPTLRSHRHQPIRLPRPWDSPGKNTGVGCHFLLQCMKVKTESEVTLLVTPWTAVCQALPSMGFSRQEYWSGVPLPSPPQLKTKTYHAEWKVFAEESIYDTISKVWKCDKPIQSWYAYICIV